MHYRQRRWFPLFPALGFATLILVSSFLGFQTEGTEAALFDQPVDSNCQRFQGSFLDNSAQAMLTRAGVVFALEDRISAFPDPALGIGAEVTWCPAPVYSIVDAGQTQTFRSWQPTVGGMLTEQRVELIGKDIVDPPLDASISNGATITITRVAEADVVKSVAIDFQTKYQDDPTINQGVTSVKVAGKAGRKEITHHIVRHDGKVVSDVVTKTEVVLEPVTKLVIRGTKPVITVACRYKDEVLAAAMVHGIDPNSLCYRMMKESHGNPKADSGFYKGLFQYDPNFWSSVSAKAGLAGASIWDAESQIKVTAWAWSHGYRGRWPNP